MSLPGPGVLFVTIGSTPGSKNIGRSRFSSASSGPRPVAEIPAPFFAAVFAAAANASGVHFSTNLRAVRLLYGPGVEPEQLGVALDLGERRRVDPVGMREDLFEDRRASRGCGRIAGRSRCRGRRAPPRRGARSGSSRSAAAVEPVRIQLHDRRVVHPFEQVLPVGGRGGGGRGLRRRGRSVEPPAVQSFRTH